MRIPVEIDMTKRIGVIHIVGKRIEQLRCSARFLHWFPRIGFADSETNTGIIVRNMYGFVVTKFTVFDYWYLLAYYMIPLSWLVCGGECVISYLAKKIKNPNYHLGSESDNHSDLVRAALRLNN